MRYCGDCGAGHECEGQAPPGTSDAVRIAEINRDRDIALARLGNRAERAALETAEEIAEVEADATVDAAVAEAEVLGAAIEASDTDPAEIIVAPQAVAEDETVEDAPPPAEGSEPPPAKSSKLGLGAW